MLVRFRRLPSNPDLPLPSRGTTGAAGFDVASAEPDFVLQPGERRLVHTGLEMELPHDVECQVRPAPGWRSSTGSCSPTPLRPSTRTTAASCV
jgi:dUTP pyrophosphatase